MKSSALLTISTIVTGMPLATTLMVVTNASARTGTRMGSRNHLRAGFCAQINECVDPTRNDCNTETQVCLDRPPPPKWECVERTPAPTPSPTRSQRDYECRSAGFKTVGLCIACTFVKLKSADCESETDLSLIFNSLIRSIPSELGKLSSVQQLDFDHNRLTGSIPSQIKDLSNDRFFHLLSSNEHLTDSC